MTDKPIIEIKEMPDKKTLEDFLKGMCGNTSVYFDTEKGKFIRTHE